MISTVVSRSIRAAVLCLLRASVLKTVVLYIFVLSGRRINAVFVTSSWPEVEIPILLKIIFTFK